MSGNFEQTWQWVLSFVDAIRSEEERWIEYDWVSDVMVRFRLRAWYTGDWTRAQMIARDGGLVLASWYVGLDKEQGCLVVDIFLTGDSEGSYEKYNN